MTEFLLFCENNPEKAAIAAAYVRKFGFADFSADKLVSAYTGYNPADGYVFITL